MNGVGFQNPTGQPWPVQVDEQLAVGSDREDIDT
jgi:hypothetical protein